MSVHHSSFIIGVMSIFSLLKVSFKALTRTKLRSLLTMLGIIIGIAAVIAMVSVGEGAQSLLQQEIQRRGTNILIVMPGSANRLGVRGGANTFASITEDDVVAIRRDCPSVNYVSPIFRMESTQVIAGNLGRSVSLRGISQEYFLAREWGAEQGETFSHDDENLARRVCVLGKTVAEDLFPGQDPVGQTIRIAKTPFRVLGVMTPRGNMGFTNLDDVIYAPWTTVKTKMTHRYLPRVDVVVLSAPTRTLTARAQTEIQKLLRERHKLRPDQEDDFMIRNMSDIADMANSVSQTTTVLLGSVAAISLLVGGIGVMNIMLVSVKERTREIGVRKAIGAREGHIQFQFLTEAVTLSLVGGALGMIFGVVSSKLLTDFLGWTTIISIRSIVIAFVFSVAIGIFFGFYPAHKASRLDPIEALRYE